MDAQRTAARLSAPAGASMTAYKGLSDERLARSVSSVGDRPFQTLYERYHQPLYRYCHSIVRNEADAHDALQSAFTRALVALRGGRRNAPLRPWLYRIAHNEAVSIVRSRSAEERRRERAQQPTYAPSADERADARARLGALLADLAALPERARGALVMRELGGLSHEEIAAALGMSAGAAKQAIFEARTGLAEIAEGREMSCDEVRRKLSDGDARGLRGRRMRSHLSDCASCTAFAAAITTRRSELRALSPLLAPAAAVTLLVRVLEHRHAGLGAGVGISGGSAAGELGASGSSSSALGAGGASATGVNGLAGGAGGVGIAAKALALVGPKALLGLAAILAAGGLALALPHGHTHPGAAHAARAGQAPAGARRGTAGSRSHPGGPGNRIPGAAPSHGVRARNHAPTKHAARHGCRGCGPPPNAHSNRNAHSNGNGNGNGNSGNHGNGPGQRQNTGNRGNSAHSNGVRNHGSNGASRSRSSSRHGHQRGGPRRSSHSRKH